MQITDLIYLDGLGWHYSDYPTILAWLTAAFQGIYGSDVIIDPDSQDGQWLGFLANAFYDVGTIGASIYNSFSPVSAQGAGLARVIKINGLTKKLATFSTVDVLLTGAAGTTITNGIAQDTLQQNWVLPTPTIIPVGGTITVTATSAVIGAITADVNTITTILTPTLGWVAVNNASAASVGQPIEPDASIRTRQVNATSLPAQTPLEATLAAVQNISGVSQAVAYENDTDATDGNGLPPHSISLVVAGGDDNSVASAIRVKKTPGAQTYGTTSIALTDSQGMPVTINFYRPTLSTINVQINITPLTGYVSTTATTIENTVSAFIQALGIGAIQNDNEVIIGQLYTPANLLNTGLGSTFKITQIQISKNLDPVGSSDLNIAFNEQPVCLPTNVDVIT